MSSIRVSPTSIHLAPALATPAAIQPTAISQAARTPYEFGQSAKRLGKFGTFPMLTPKPAGAPPEIGAISATLAKKAVAEAKELIHQAEALLGSKEPGDRSRAYDLIRDAGKKLEAAHPHLAAQFDTVADKFRLRDPQVKEYDSLMAWHFGHEYANKMAKEVPDGNRGWDQLPITGMFLKATAELNKL